MLNLTNKLQIDLNEKDLSSSVAHIYDHIDRINIPAALKQIIFPENFLDHRFYFIIPKFFKDIYQTKNKKFVNDICNSGYFYFRYLLCLDSLADQDILLENEEAKSNLYKMQILQSHIYHEQALITLGHYFGKNKDFWNTWDKRNKDFLQSIQMDSFYNISLTIQEYESLCIGKCSFTNVAVDVFEFYTKNKDQEIYNDLIEINNLFSIGRCIQDDIEDFKKDLIFKKNNLGHVFLNNWLKSKNLDINNYSHEELERLLISSGELENLLMLSIQYFKRAINLCEKYGSKLIKYKKLLSSILNTIIFYKVQVEAYRIDVLIKNKVGKFDKLESNNIQNAITISKGYISNLQFQNGSWYENLNKQGFSNSWATGFITSFLDECTEKDKSIEFLKKSHENNLWGYNTDWSYDYDSTTCSLINIVKTKKDGDLIKIWQSGQNDDGGFSTYPKKDSSLLEKINLKSSNVKGWVQSHICVSALAYYFVVSKKMEDHIDFQKLKNYIFSNTNKDGIWEAYWWTSPVYPTCFILQGMILEKQTEPALIEEKLKVLFSLQNDNGSFSCPVNKTESAFYTSLVLDTICLEKKYFDKFSIKANKLCNWLLENQLSNGSFDNTLYQVIPNPNVKQWKANHKFNNNKFGGSNSITGEQYGLFSTSVALRAYSRFSKINS
ncbi:prenyltransferase/squalene oxidase repeat-containing protein [Chryseobacterium sp. ISL-6]|uniref:prenyltransferase/squalene oxidase repeat-containing protein n=1 Tax=Chryseobacterium sp. ISL-6 TaxID=2819143 RepID=UPI001BEC34AB|nr:prenyltransferase/squalene oxidase repeat-containing protein [Chryseobacterium sp. ISL-6]MBT2621278.1 hypothetical protein [Chryseobacterium sp. ISL-6]